MTSRRVTVNRNHHVSPAKPVQTEQGYPKPSSAPSGLKRKREIIDLTGDSEDEGQPSPSPATSQKRRNQSDEKRLRVFRKNAPKTYLDRLARVRTQRMFLLDRQARTSLDGVTAEGVFDIAGTTGNVYQVTISRQPSCTCPDAAKGNQCKHIIYVMVNVLKAPEHLCYQLALLSTELAEVFAQAPSTPQSSSQACPASTTTDGNRKPVEGDCPICVMEFEEGESIVWCKAACGNNIHKQCFEQWARSKPGATLCVYCRTPWQSDASAIDVKKVATQSGRVSDEGYVNVAAELGISGRRDTSSYYHPWVSRRYGRGMFGGYDGYGDYDDF
ncbi:RING finger protein Znf1 [Coleophoma crateriformis]|uniref:RING finger protein Znf1 n=1 Tax=Coleophoma crateriformis TaxID=565419 RepID=A0A3D8SYT9_9HELO|nr:RING finger protein Znf1 [Coleophoma crateriformis]